MAARLLAQAEVAIRVLRLRLKILVWELSHEIIAKKNKALDCEFGGIVIVISILDPGSTDLGSVEVTING